MGNCIDLSASLAIRAHKKGLELICRIMPGVPVNLKGDPDRLRQIIINLIGNAIKFTENGGPRDAFERAALQGLGNNPDVPYYKFVDYKGIWSLRYSIADPNANKLCFLPQ